MPRIEGQTIQQWPTRQTIADKTIHSKHINQHELHKNRQVTYVIKWQQKPNTVGRIPRGAWRYQKGNQNT